MESTSSPHHNGGQTETAQHPPPQQMLGHMVPVVHDALTFDDRQTQRMKEMEKFVNDEAKRRKREWEKDVERMREEFLHLQPSDETKSDSGGNSCTNSPSHYQLTQIQKHSRHSSGEQQANGGITSTPSNTSLTKVGFIRKDDDLIAKRRGSTDVLDSKKMKTLFMEYPGSGLRYKLRFDVSDFEPENVHVTADNSRITVKATKQVKCNETGDPVEKEFERKIEKPAGVDHTKLKSCLTTDGILIIEAPLPPKSLGLRKTTSNHASPSRAQQSNATLTNTAAVSSSVSIRSGSPPATPTNCSSPFKREKRGQVYFHNDEDSASGGRRKMTLVLDIGLAFGAKEITILIIKDNRIRVKARHEERTPEKLVKNKFTKEFELSERIETYSLRAGLTTDGKLIVKALGKGHCDGLNKVSAGELVAEEINCLMDNNACNVLDLSSFPPTTPQLIASSYNGSV
ncbi:hypothetical protein HELRODRAFT_169784 [Helobdella robusta]|uniref:SHSP domain-containing protein n=1 Tax=Helobdella robusta TaxID=6412 RepID=T1F2B5_HELRO|nr:hypothetical protein HELRODRAFT_169784 [Helobdella robusta]ESO08061.1 hypothetical protein HELRODRAFT_169784 [Helobdella robusta]